MNQCIFCVNYLFKSLKQFSLSLSLSLTIFIQLQTDSVFNLSSASLLEIGETKIDSFWQVMWRIVNYRPLFRSADGRLALSREHGSVDGGQRSRQEQRG